MKRIFLSPMPWAVMLLGVIAIASMWRGDATDVADDFRVWSMAQSPEQDADYALLRPFVSPAGTYSIAMEGGRQPIFAYEIPSVTLGAASKCPLQILLLADWDAPTTLALYDHLEKTYQADPSLPSLKLSLLPSRSGQSQGHFIEWIIAVHFVANQASTMPTFLHEISTGALTSEKEVIRKRLEQIEPDIVSRAEVFLQSQKPVVEKIYLIAQAQIRLHEKTLQCAESTQLVSMQQILTGSPKESQIKAFLLHAQALQAAYLASPAGLTPIEPKRPR
jgi:hypothetical protein